MTKRLTLMLVAVIALMLPATTGAATRCNDDMAELQTELTDQHFPVGTIDGCDGAATRAAVQAFQKANGLSADGVAGPKTLAALDAPATLKPVSKSKRLHVEVDLTRQLLLVVDRAKITKVYSVSTGMQGHETPVGTFKVGRKELKSWSVPYKVWLPYASYFTSDGVAFHAGTTEIAKASHGCVRVPAAFAKEIYTLLKPGTTVLVTRAPALA